MPESEPGNVLVTYICGKCKGVISYVKDDGRPDKCPECKYEHGTRDVHDIPSTIRLNLNELGG